MKQGKNIFFNSLDIEEINITLMRLLSVPYIYRERDRILHKWLASLINFI